MFFYLIGDIMNEFNVNDINLIIKGFDFFNEEDFEVCV